MHPSRLNFSGSKQRNSLGSYLKEAAAYEPKRSMSNARLVNTILTLLMAIILAYSSLFYIPSLFNTTRKPTFKTVVCSCYESLTYEKRLFQSRQ